jgi:integrase/recombinase XerD
VRIHIIESLLTAKIEGEALVTGREDVMTQNELCSHVLDPAEQIALLEQPDAVYPVGHRNLTVLTLLLELGLRISEVVHLTWDDFDAAGKTLTVSTGHPVQHRQFLLSEHLLHLLRGWKKRQKAGWMKRRSSEQKEVPDQLFTELSGECMSDSYVHSLVRESLEDAGITRSFSPNVLRHTFATEQYLETGDIDRVHCMLGNMHEFTTVLEARDPVHARSENADTPTEDVDTSVMFPQDTGGERTQRRRSRE